MAQARHEGEELDAIAELAVFSGLHLATLPLELGSRQAFLARYGLSR